MRVKEKRIFPKAIISFILAILTATPMIGYIFGLASIILAIDLLVSLNKEKNKRGKALAISALVITASIVLIKIIVFFTSLFGGIIGAVGNFSQLSYEDAVVKCKEQAGDLQTTCYMGLIVLHANDTRVKSGETCYNIGLDESRATCFSFVAALTNNTKMCEEIKLKENLQETFDMRNYCFAMITNKGDYCGYISDSAAKLKCESEIMKRKMGKDIYSG